MMFGPEATDNPEARHLRWIDPRVSERRPNLTSENADWRFRVSLPARLDLHLLLYTNRCSEAIHTPDDSDRDGYTCETP